MFLTSALLISLLAVSGSNPACSQAASERNRLIDEAERNEFTVRRVEFIGNTHTRDRILRTPMTAIVNEGDVFPREKLVRSLRRMSTLKRVIYPVRVTDVAIRLDRTERLVDMTICFRERRRR